MSSKFGNATASTSPNLHANKNHLQTNMRETFFAEMPAELARQLYKLYALDFALMGKQYKQQ